MDSKASFVVYQIINNITGKWFVGSTDDWSRRKRDHINLLNKNKHHCIYLQRSWNKHSSPDFMFIIISYHLTREKAYQVEQTILDKFFSEGYLYNTNPNAIKPPINKSYGKDNPFYGKTHSDEYKERLRKEMKGNIFATKDIRFTLQSPDGKIISCSGINTTARKYNLDAAHLQKVVRQHRGYKSTRGWRLYNG